MGNMTQVMFSHQTGQNNMDARQTLNQRVIPADMCITKLQLHQLIDNPYVSNISMLATSPLIMSAESAEKINTRQNCTQSTQDPILLAQSSSMVVLVCFFMQRSGLD